MAPVMAGLCLYESIYSGKLDLVDFARMNDALAVKYENEHRASVAANKKPPPRR